MARVAGDAVPEHDRVQVVAALIGCQRAREPHGAEDRRAKAPPGAAEFIAQEAVVEARVVRDEEPALDAGFDGVRDRLEGRRIGDHRVGDARELLDGVRDANARIHERRILLDDDAVLDEDDADLHDAVARRVPARGLEVHAGDPACEGAFSCGHRPASGADRRGPAGGRGTGPRNGGSGGSRRNRSSRSGSARCGRRPGR